MVPVSKKFFHRVPFLPATAFFVWCIFLFSVILIFFYHGVPIHDFNLWKLETKYELLGRYHGAGSIVLAKKKYLGGPDTHGSQTCSYVVGEVRLSTRSKGEISRTYRNSSISILFVDDVPWPTISPFAEWQDELYQLPERVEGNIYLAYVKEEGYPYFGDLRCDD